MTGEQFEAVCRQIQIRDAGIGAICKEIGMAKSTFYAYLRQKATPDEIDMYARAKRDQLEIVADEIIDIADGTDDNTPWITRKDGEDVEAVVDSATNRLRVDSRKWLLSKLMPRVYGDKTTLEHTGDAMQTIIYLPSNSRDAESS